jgi:hypothetical protein
VRSERRGRKSLMPIEVVFRVSVGEVNKFGTSAFFGAKLDPNPVQTRPSRHHS